jgi:hypothetical protein
LDAIHLLSPWRTYRGVFREPPPNFHCLTEVPALMCQRQIERKAQRVPNPGYEWRRYFCATQVQAAAAVESIEEFPLHPAEACDGVIDRAAALRHKCGGGS